MSIFNQTNQGRVTKIIEICDLLEKSVISNAASPDDVWELLKPVLDRLSQLVGVSATKPEIASPDAAPGASGESSDPFSGSGPKRTPSYITIRDLAQTAPLEDLAWAMAVFINRFDEYLDQHPKKE